MRVNLTEMMDSIFFHGKTAHVSGRGEKIDPIKMESDYYVLLVMPNTTVSTAEAYKSLGMHLTKNDNGFKFESSNLVDLSVRNFKNILHNDFENSIFEKYPNLLEIKNLLYREKAKFASLSGSGSTVYGIYSSLKQVQKIYNKLSKFLSCLIAKQSDLLNNYNWGVAKW